MKKILFTLVIVIVNIFVCSAQKSLEQGILFKKDSINISASQMDRLGLIVEYLKNHPNQKVIIGGFTSKTTPGYMVDIVCEKRAKAVKDCLVREFKIPETRLTAIGVGVSTKYKEPEFNNVVEFFVQ